MKEALVKVNSLIQHTMQSSKEKSVILLLRSILDKIPMSSIAGFPSLQYSNLASN